MPNEAIFDNEVDAKRKFIELLNVDGVSGLNFEPRGNGKIAVVWHQA